MRLLEKKREELYRHSHPLKRVCAGAICNARLTRPMFFRLFVTLIVGLAALALASCTHSPGRAVAAGHGFTRSALVGVWEVIASESSIPRQMGSPATMPNSKYCFSSDEAYPDLAADSINDSADGGGSYDLVGDDVLIIHTGVPGAIYSFQLTSVSKDQIVWHQNTLRVTLRRIADKWDGSHAPKLPRKDIRISYPP